MSNPESTSGGRGTGATATPSAAPASAAADGAEGRRPQRLRGHQRVEALLGAAAAVFVDKGYAAATMTEIAAQAASSIGSLYQFFPTKELLAQALLRVQAEDLQQRLAAMAEASPGWSVDELARRLCRALIDFRAAHPSFAGLIESPGVPHEHVAGVRQQMRGQLAEILRPHAPDLGKARLLAIATAVQQVMKATVTLNTEGRAARAPQAELNEMLRLYLQAALGKGEAEA